MNSPPTTAKSQAPSTKVRTIVKRQLIVNPKFQYRMLVPIAIFAATLAVLLIVFVFYPFQYDAGHDPNPTIRALLAARAINLQIYFSLAFALSMVIASLYTLIRSNRLAGPLYKLRVVLIQQAEGKIMRLRFREGDEFREFEDVVNRLAKRMESLSTGNVYQLSMIQKRLKFLKARVQSEEMPTVDICRELDAALKDIGMD